MKGNHRVCWPLRTMASTLSNDCSYFSFHFLVTCKTMIFKYFKIQMCEPTWKPKSQASQLPSASCTWQNTEQWPWQGRDASVKREHWPLNKTFAKPGSKHPSSKDSMQGVKRQRGSISERRTLKHRDSSYRAVHKRAARANRRHDPEHTLPHCLASWLKPRSRT